MDNELGAIKEMHEQQSKQIIDKLQKKIDTTKYNIEVSKEIIAETPSNSQEEKLTKKNMQRCHAIASLEKEIRDIEQVMEES